MGLSDPHIGLFGIFFSTFCMFEKIFLSGVIIWRVSYLNVRLGRLKKKGKRNYLLFMVIVINFLFSHISCSSKFHLHFHIIHQNRKITNQKMIQRKVEIFRQRNSLFCFHSTSARFYFKAPQSKTNQCEIMWH